MTLIVEIREAKGDDDAKLLCYEASGHRIEKNLATAIAAKANAKASKATPKTAEASKASEQME